MSIITHLGDLSQNEIVICQNHNSNMSQITIAKLLLPFFGLEILGEVMETTTRNQSTQAYTEVIGNDTLKQNIKTYLLNPLSAGLAGFALLFSLMLMTKLFSYILGINAVFNLGLNDVIYALVGFVFGAGAKFFEFFGKEE